MQGSVKLSAEMVTAIKNEISYMLDELEPSQTEAMAMQGYALATLINVVLQVEERRAERHELTMLEAIESMNRSIEERAEAAPEPEEERPAPPAEPVKKVSAPKKKPGPKPKRVDYGRIGALWKGGWSQTKIADDIGCSISTVSRAIAERRWEKIKPDPTEEELIREEDFGE